MLTLKFGSIDKAFLSGDSYFDAWVDESVIETDFGKEVIGQIEKGIVHSSQCIVIPVIGGIPPERLSGSTKTLLTLYSDNSKVFNLSALGDNCFKLLAHLAEMKDIRLCTDTFRDMYSKGFYGDILIENSGNIITNDNSLLEEWIKANERFL